MNTIDFSKIGERFQFANINSILKLSDNGRLTIELGSGYPDEVLDNVYYILEDLQIDCREVDICAEVLGGFDDVVGYMRTNKNPHEQDFFKYLLQFCSEEDN